ncbi:hypothetical protein UK23_35370 [Lentzea aerocolonigenes]|uniref:Restriction endonuclease type IV Mrr domain-containing protein n=1 Tax=Lentzea aerocolonigenes TaxID=68170 RepID=A0A0F0GN61_LENAE|nr:hypothetical protein UK23_35370 [Lentzea aerocolonigenes]
MTPDTFEDFTERVLSAHRFCGPGLRKVMRVERWGRRGDKQDGIDFEGTFSDGATAAWQCKRYDRLTPRNVREAVAACTFQADEYYLVFSGEASDAARSEMRRHVGWQLLDRRGLGRLIDDLPLHKRRDVLDATWGPATRKLLLEMPGEDGFLSLAAFAADRRNPETVLNDLGPRVGRGTEQRQLEAAVDRSADWQPIVLVSGPGGRGKTRLLVEALELFERHTPTVPVVVLSPGLQLSPVVLGELPQVPAVIVIDDAHHDPAALAPLLTYARAVPGTQLVAASRPAGLAALRAQIAAARYSSGQIREIAIGQLAKPEARELVESLTAGLGLPWPLREYFADQAVDSPYVAVVAANLIRRGELTTPLAVDGGLRQQILARYQDLSLDDVERNPARRILAVYAALGSVNDDDAELATEIAMFCGLELAHALRLVTQLKDKGVLATRHGGTRVTPDVLADEILEREAAVGRTDTGFVLDLWRAFGARFATRLVAEIAELDWRFAQQGGPAVFAGIWETVRSELQVAATTELPSMLRSLSGLATTQPRRLIEALEEVRLRVQDLDDGNAKRTRFALAELYGGCATYAPELLETALDALWSLRRNDHRPTNQYPEHPERVVTDHLANIGRLPDSTFPDRIVQRVEAWLTEGDEHQDAVSPLFALKPLLEKDGYRTEQDAPHTLAFKPFVVSPEWARPLRDRIRGILRAEASSDDLRRASAAVDLLRHALRPPQGGFGDTPSTEEVLAWQEDDLATVAVLTEAAASTRHAVIRRLIRHSVTWPADHAKSLLLRRQALTLITALDEREDDLAELMLGRGQTTSMSRAGLPIPTLEELQTADDAEALARSGLSEEEQQARSLTSIEAHLSRKRAERDALVTRVIASLTATSNAASIVRTLDDVARQVRLVDARGGMSSLFLRELADARPELTADLVEALAANEPGPLDRQLAWLLSTWAAQDESALLAWLGGVAGQRMEVRLAVADAVVDSGWASRGGAFTSTFRQGMNDQDPQVRSRFLLGSHALLSDFPVATVDMLLAADISGEVAADVLDRASNYNGSSWGRNLSKEDAGAVLRLVDRAGWDGYVTEQIASGIALSHPVLMLDQLKAVATSGRSLPADVEGIGAAFNQNAVDLVRWLIDEIERDAQAAAVVLRLAMTDGMTESQADCLVAEVSRLTADKLVALATALTAVRTWPVSHPDLARQLLVFSRASGQHAAAAVRVHIAEAMWPASWSFNNGTSPKLARVRSQALHALENESDDELKAEFQKVADDLEAEMSRVARRHEEWQNS